MDPNNISGITVKDLDESDFSEVSSISANLKQILNKIKQLEAKVAQNTEQSGAGSSYSGFQIGEKLGKLKEKMEGMKKEMEVLRTENVGLKEGMAKMKNAEKDRAMVELNKGMAQKDEENIRLKIEIAEQKVQNAKLEDNNRGMKRKIERIETYFPKTKKVLKNRRALPAELLSELFASLPMENALHILAKLPNGLLERNMRKMLKSIEMAMRNNKWNEADYGPELTISEGGRVVKHSGPIRDNSVRAQMSIPKFNLNAKNASIAYFEVEIVAKDYSGCIHIGFCTQQFLLEGNLVGHVQNSIGICYKGGIYIDGKNNNFGNGGGYFQTGNVIGIGIVHFPSILSTKCFATLNGQLLGSVALCQKFAALQLFPAVSMYYQNDSIRANFGTKPWRCNPLEIVGMLN